MKKYELKEVAKGRRYYRIVALRDFADVKAGDVGGFVESEHNLSHEGNCWIYDNAKVVEEARVCQDAKVMDNAEMYGNSRAKGNAIVREVAMLTDNSKVSMFAEISGGAVLWSDSEVEGSAKVKGYAELVNKALVRGNAVVDGNARILDASVISGDSKIGGVAIIGGESSITGEVLITKGTYLDIEVKENFLDIISINTDGRKITIYRDTKGVLRSNIGCQKGMTIERLRARIEEDGGMSEHRQRYLDLMTACELILKRQ